MAADDVVVEPGDMLLLHTGFATEILKWNREPDPVKIHTLCTYLDARDESLLQWITDSQISALVADNYAVEGLLGQGPRREPALVPPHPPPLPVPARRAPGRDVVPPRAGLVAAGARPEPVPAHRAPAAAARHRGLPADAGGHRLTDRAPRRLGSASDARRARSGSAGSKPERLVVAVGDPSDLLEELRPAARVQEVLPGLPGDVGPEEVAALPEGRRGPRRRRPSPSTALRPRDHLDGVVAVVAQVDERVGDEVDLVAVVPRVVAGRGVGSAGEEEVREAAGLDAEEGLRAVGPVVGRGPDRPGRGSPCGSARRCRSRSRSPTR